MAINKKRRTLTGGRDATGGVIPGRFVLSVGKPDLPSPSGWHWTKLTDVTQLESGHTPSRKHDEYWDGTIPWIGIKDAGAHHGRYIFNTLQHVTEAGVQNSSTRLLPTNTVCLSRTASIGYVTIMGTPMCTSQDFVNWVCGDLLNPRFLLYALLAEQESLWRFAHGTSHQTIYYPEVKAFHINLPPRSIQEEIVHVLGALDDNIELNGQLNEALEAMAQTIFQSWFIDFDPVKAKQAALTFGYDPERAAMAALSGTLTVPKELNDMSTTMLDEAETRLDELNADQLDELKQTASLFPSRLVESELGLIPEGWGITNLESYIELAYGKALKKSIRTPGNIPVYGSGGINGYHNESLIDGPGIIVGRKGTVGSLYWEDRPFFPIDTVFFVKPKHTNSLEFIYYLLQTLGLERMNTDAAVPGLNRNNAYRLDVVQFPERLKEQFYQVVHPLKETMQHKKRQNSVLAELRDTLLPQLLSGKLSVIDTATK